jgi:23S rRNA (uracil1939-C5)-methyltransferase
MEPIIGMDDAFPVRYRGKAQFPVGRDREGNIVTGFYAGHSHSIIPIDDCVIGAKEYAKITGIIRDHMKHYDIAPYDENSGTGLVRHILIRKGYKTGELMVCLVLNRGKSSNGIYLTGQDELIKELGKINNMTSVSVNLNTHNTNVIMGDETYTIWGSDVIHDVIETVDADERAITYSISPLSFYQVNPKQTDRLYSKVLQYAGLTGKETVWDLYCGTGTISLFLAGSAAHVYGVEIVPDAIKDAIRNAKDNGIDNVSFYVGKAEDIYLDGSDTASEGGILLSDRPDVIVVDPPRKGCDQVLINTMLSAAPGKIVYVSCDPATLSRDLKLLCDGGYELKAVTPTDMFPHCVHIENCCLLTRTSA